jgi:hypothetical protein
MGQSNEIASMLMRMMLSLDHQDRDGFADCWSQTIRFNAKLFDGQGMAFNSRDEMVEGVTAHWTGQASNLRHQLGGIDIQLQSPDRATAHFYCLYLNVGGDFSLAGMGEYSDEIVREADGHWRVSKRDHSFLTPLNVAGR